MRMVVQAINANMARTASKLTTQPWVPIISILKMMLNLFSRINVNFELLYHVPNASPYVRKAFPTVMSSIRKKKRQPA